MLRVLVTGKNYVLPYRQDGILNKDAKTNSFEFRFFNIIGKPDFMVLVKKIMERTTFGKRPDNVEIQISVKQYKQSHTLFKNEKHVNVSFEFLGKGENNALQRWIEKDR